MGYVRRVHKVTSRHGASQGTLVPVPSLFPSISPTLHDFTELKIPAILLWHNSYSPPQHPPRHKDTCSHIRTTALSSLEYSAGGGSYITRMILYINPFISANNTRHPFNTPSIRGTYAMKRKIKICKKHNTT